MEQIRIEDHGVIGDLHTVALVALDGSIDFMAFPHFDSPTIFASLLDREKGGCFRLAPVLEKATHRQLYLPDTNMLLTRFLSEEGVAEVSDFMPLEEAGAHAHNIVRRAKTVRGRVRFRMSCAPRFDYARAEHSLEPCEHGVLFRSRGADGLALRLKGQVPIEIRRGDAVAEFTLEAGQSVAFVLEQADADSPPCKPEYVADCFKRTMNFWHGWLGKAGYRGRWREMVNRSALALKLLTSRQHGSMIAAPTFSLPERLGGGRNWDYRYVWIRDASFTLYALIRLGFTDEARAFMHWIEARCEELNPDGSLAIMYRVDGSHELPESELEHLSGYADSRPVRIGNGAVGQLQLDIYGELMDAVYLSDKYATPISYDLWRNLLRLLDWLSRNWQQPDEGIWEVRGGRWDFLYSRVLCWVAFDRAVRLATKRSLPGPVQDWIRIRDCIYREVMESFWDAERGAFLQYKGGKALDAAALIMPLVRFVSPTDPRWLRALAAIERELVDDSLVYRYHPDHAAEDGVGGAEGTFSICSFWFVECLSRAGDLHKARFLLDKILGYANHVGLYAEQLGPRGEHLGNFPQAFTHLALISAAHHLDRSLSDAGWRA